jgi:methyltransferase-like protein
MKPIIKFNNGNGAILCNRCKVIIKENLTKEEVEGKTDLLLCKKCEEKEYLKKCKELLKYFGVDYSKDTIKLTDGGNSCIMYPKSKFYKLFGGYSINSVAEYVAEKLNKKTEWID